MEIELVRLFSQADSTLGALYLLGPRRFLCFSLEDQFHAQKVPGETRIPEGRYRLALRRTGSMHIHYAARFQAAHKGMLHLQGVQGFDFIYLHVGNTTADTRGCILLGDTAMPRVGYGEIGGSEIAYRRVYPPIAQELVDGRDVWLTVTDFA